MIVHYDGSFEGLMTVVYQKYHELPSLEIVSGEHQVSLFQEAFVATEALIAEKVLAALKRHFGAGFVTECLTVFLSAFPDKDSVIAQVIYGMYHEGQKFLNASRDAAVRFQSMLRNVRSEIHTFHGLLRFRAIEGNVLYAAFEPKHDVLTFLTKIFMERMPKEAFIIHDVGRRQAVFCRDGVPEFVRIEEMMPVDTKDERIVQEAWRSFYRSVVIEARRNPGLMQQNMPKKYWGYLPERQTLGEVYDARSLPEQVLTKEREDG